MLKNRVGASQDVVREDRPAEVGVRFVYPKSRSVGKEVDLYLG